MTSSQWSHRGGDVPPDIDTFLAQRKRQGSTLLVTGAVDETISGIATRRLLGDPGRERKRVLAFSDASADYVDYCLPVDTPRDDPDVWVVTPDGTHRGGPVPDDGAKLSTGGVGPEDVAGLQAELTQAVTRYDDASEGLAPAELRLGVISLAGFLEANDRSTVEQFLRTLGELVRGVDGMAHVHLPVPDADPLVDELSPLFDARIELRHRETFLPEQRWHVPEHGITTLWTEL
jgi:hypothetical protein